MKQKLFLTLLLLLAATTATAHAREIMVDGIYYIINGNEAEVTSYYQYSDEYSGEVSIPETVTYNGESYTVTSIGNHAFSSCESLTRVTIPNSVTSIGDFAFDGCIRLKNVTIGNSVTSIGDYAFNACFALTSVAIPNSVTSIGVWAFYCCESLTSVTIGNSVTSIGECAFGFCKCLASIKVESGNTEYDSRENCNAIIETASNTLITGCINTVIPNSVTAIGNLAFYGCVGLTSVVIPNSVTAIGNLAFYGCVGLTSVVIPNSVTAIGNSVFEECSGLTDVYFLIEDPSKVSIGIDVFYVYNEKSFDYSGRTLHVPAGSLASYQAVNYWNYYFGQIVEIDSVEVVDGDIKIGGIYYKIHDTTATVTYMGADSWNHNTYTGSVNIPSMIIYAGKGYSVTCIGVNAFCNCTGLTSVTIPNTVTTIGDYSFYNCSGLTNLTIPKSVTRIGWAAFSDCSGLTNINVDDRNTQYDSRNGCNAIIETRSNSLIVGCKNTIIPNSVASIYYHAFAGCRGLTSVNIPNSVYEISDGAFSGCSGLMSITVEDGNTYYDSRNGCNAIIETRSNSLIVGCKNTIIPNSVTSIDNSAFEGCSSLTSVTIPNSVNAIGYSAFRYCSGLTDVYSLIEDLSKVSMEINVFYLSSSSGSDYSGRTLHVPAGTLASYQADENWYPYFGAIVEMDPIVEVVPGDVDGDGKLTVNDVTDLIDKILSGTATIESLPAADANGDGKIDINDITYLVDQILSPHQ